MRTESELTSGFNNVEITAVLGKSSLVETERAKTQHNGFKKEWEERT